MVYKKILLEGDAAELSDTVPVDVTVAAASAGVATEASRQDHKHDISVKVNELNAPDGALAMNSQKITGLAAGVAEGDAVALDVNLRAPDSTLLEGDSKATVQDHTPKAHLLGAHDTDTLANLNAKVTDATLDDSGDPRDPNAHAASHKSGAGDEVDLDELGDPTGAVNFAEQEATALALENLASDPASIKAGYVYFNTVDGHPYVYVP